MENDLVRILNIKPSDAQEIKYSQFMSDIEYLPLQAPDSILIGELSKIEFVQQRYYVFDFKRLFVFDENGRFLFRVGAIGRGPGEYIYPYCFAIDTIQETIEIYCRGNGKLSMFKLSNGEFLGDLSLNIYPDDLIKTQNGSYLFHGEFYNTEMKLTSIKKYNKVGIADDLSFTYQNKLSKHAYDLIGMGRTNNAFSQHAEGILYTRNLDNNIYLISENDIRVKYKLDFGDANLPLTNNFLDKYKYGSDILKNTDKVVFFTGHWSNELYLYFFVLQKNNRIYVIYNVRDKMLLYGKTFKNDIDLGPTVYIAGINEKSLIGFIPPSKFLDHFTNIKAHKELWYKANKINPQIKSIFRTIDPSDNPILAICKLK